MRLPVDDRRAQLVEVGLRLFSEKAYGDVAIDEIAEGAGVAKGVLYHYFAGKKGLYLVCLDRASDEMLRAVATDPAVAGPARVAQGLAAYLAFVEDRAAA